MDKAKLATPADNASRDLSRSVESGSNKATESAILRRNSRSQNGPRQQTWSRPVFSRLRWQLPAVVISCTILPAGIVSATDGLAVIHNNPETLMLTAGCSILALILFRRLESFPGISSLGYVIPSALAPFIVALVGILAFRLEYSRSYLLFSAAISTILFVALWAYHRHRCAPVVYVLPGAHISPTARLKLKPISTPPEEMERHSIVAVDLRLDMAPHWDQFILNSALAGIPVYHSKSLEESITGKVEIEHLSENTFGSVVPSSIYSRTKRILDVSVLVLFSPFIIGTIFLVAAIIKLSTRDRVFFFQERVGFRGKTFTVVKFRTMVSTEFDDGNSDQLINYMTMENDARVTRVGRFLRRYRLDELPQVLNIVRGEMSWIGPRPEAELLSCWYDMEIPFYGYRHMVRPGITGWAQVNQGHVVDVNEVKEKLYYDFYYIKHFSIWLDLLIVARTLRTLFIGNGAS